MSQLRGILNPNISREEEQAAWDQYHQSAMESITERAKALEAANRKLILSPEAVKALGPVSPEQAWGQITNMLRHVLEEYRETGEDLMKKTASDLPGDLESLVGDMETPGAYPPVSTINHLLESTPDLSLRDIDHLPPLTILKAILRMLMINEAYL